MGPAMHACSDAGTWFQRTMLGLAGKQVEAFGCGNRCSDTRRLGGDRSGPGCTVQALLPHLEATICSRRALSAVLQAPRPLRGPRG